jgi:CHAT domain-containing protein
LQEYANRPEAPSPVYLLATLRPGTPEDDRIAYDVCWAARAIASSVTMQRRRARGPEIDYARGRVDELRQWLSAAVSKPDVTDKEFVAAYYAGKDLESLEEIWAEAVSAKHPTLFRKPAELVKLLPPKTALVEYLRVSLPRPPRAKKAPWTFDEVYEAFVVRVEAGQLVVKRRNLGPADKIDVAAIDFRNAMAPSFPMERPKKLAGMKAVDPGWELKKLAVAPLAADLVGAETILIAPDGFLTQVPFCALPGKAPKTFWGDEVMIAAAASGPGLAEILLATKPPDDKTALLVGGVECDPPESLIEMLFGGASPGPDVVHGLAAVKDIAGMLAGWKVDLQTGRAADERTLRKTLGRDRWVHFCTHGYHNDRLVTSRSGGLFANNPKARETRNGLGVRHPLLTCGLACASAGAAKFDLSSPVPPIDNLLSAEEISAMHLENVELAVLGACGTGLGTVEFGEGSANLAKAFHLAGVRSVVSSRWPIFVESSTQFNRRYFANLVAGKSKLEALTEAQRWLRAQNPKWSAPEHWAPFVLSGDWR